MLVSPPPESPWCLAAYMGSKEDKLEVFFKSVFKPFAKVLGISDKSKSKSRRESSRAPPVEGAGPGVSQPACGTEKPVEGVDCVLLKLPPHPHPHFLSRREAEGDQEGEAGGDGECMLHPPGPVPQTTRGGAPTGIAPHTHKVRLAGWLTVGCGGPWALESPALPSMRWRCTPHTPAPSLPLALSSNLQVTKTGVSVRDIYRIGRTLGTGGGYRGV